MRNWKYRLASYMAGRYGIDELNKFLIVAAFVLFILSVFILHRPLYLLGWMLLIYSYVRIMSRNILKRQMENMKYLQKKESLLSKKYGFFRCPNCGQNCRVPKNKGKIRITCPKCGNKFEERT